MTPEQNTIHGATSISDLWPDLSAAGWRFRYPDSLEWERESDDLRVGPDAVRSARAGVLKVVGVLVLIVALLMYLAVPFNTFVRTQTREQAPTRARPIPAPPQHDSVRLGV